MTPDEKKAALSQLREEMKRLAREAVVLDQLHTAKLLIEAAEG